MASAMTCYTADWERDNVLTCKNFTGANMRQQLGQVILAFLDATTLAPAHENIYEAFMADDTITFPRSGSYPTFLPWGPEQLPFTLSHNRSL